MQHPIRVFELGIRQTAYRWIGRWLAIALTLILSGNTFGDVRIKDITFVDGQLSHTLTGMGLVAGLNGTGGTIPQTREFASNMLLRYGNRMDPILRELVRTDNQFKTDSLSVVIVTATVPEFASPGTPFDVTVSAFDDAESLLGGVLVLTPLSAIDGEVYATATGNISTGGFAFGGDAASAQQNHPTTGKIPNGGTIQKAFCQVKPNSMRRFRLSLNHPDLETAGRIAFAINEVLPKSAVVITPGMVEVRLPQDFEISGTDFLSQVQQLRVKVDTAARVVINERTGTVVFGENVKISQVAITHANLTILTSETPEVSQPNEFSDGETVVLPRTNVEVFEEDSRLQVFPETTSVGDLVQALNSLGVTPRDLSSIFQQLKAAGKLHAHLEFN